MRLVFLSIGRHIHTERWISWFAERGHECHLLTVQPGEIPGVQVHDIRYGFGPKPLRYAFSLRRVKDILSALQPDLLNTHFLTGYGYWGHYSGFHPNVLTVWGDDIYVTPFESSLKKWLARRALLSCDALTGDSTDILLQAANLGADPERAYRVLWGVDFDDFRSRDAMAWRREAGYSAQEILIISPRSFTQPYYNIDTVIAAAAKVRKQEPRVRFLFSGYEGDPAPFWAMARTAGIAEISSFRGRIAHDQFALALNAADIFISVPSVDATAVSLLEAMSCTSAIIVSKLPSALEWVTDRKSALVVEPRDVDALADAMLVLVRDPELRRTLGKQAQAKAHAVAGFADNMGYVESIFRKLINGEGDLPVDVSLSRLVSRKPI